MEPNERTCYACNNFWICSASAGYSEFTPGTNWSMSCIETVWEFDAENDNEVTFAKCLDTAKTCNLFKQRSR